MAYFTNGNSPGTVQVMDTANYKTVRSIAVGNMPVDVLMAPDDAFMLVTNFLGMSISVINPVTSSVVSTIPMSSRVRGLALVQ